MYKKISLNFPLAVLTVLLLVMLLISSVALANPVENPHKNSNLSFDFRNIPTRDLLGLLAELKGLNLIISDAVVGNLTLHLENINWTQALDSILTMQQLDKKIVDNILYIAPSAETTAYAQQRLQTQPLLFEHQHVRYAKAADLAELIQKKPSDLLSDRGSVVADSRTNSLWIKDVATHLPEIHAFIASLDVPMQQVQIAARIVNMDQESANELGLKFGTVTENTTENSTDSLHMDMPLTIADVGHFTIAIAKLGTDTLLDLELSALEREGRAEIISNPQLITANQQTALIESGEEIPYQEQTASGATNTTFKKAVLSLKVTPEVTGGNKILLNLTVNQDKVSALTVNGVPAISTQEVQTQVLANNGETIVLGGIYQQSNSKVIERIPFWGSIPVIGALFTNKQTHSTRKELLIFVTPSIVLQ